MFVVSTFGIHAIKQPLANFIKQCVLNKNFKYNPFSGILEDDIGEILVPKFSLDNIIHKINNSDSLAIEFIGKQGRGKTTHLVYLQKQMEEYPIFLLNHKSSITDIINNKANIIFIDSIHHLNFFDRVKIFKEKKVVIYTTHWSRKFDCFLARKNNQSIKFKGINEEILREVLNKRLRLASHRNFEPSVICSNDVKTLIKNFGDNYRGIINHLYVNYQ
ncbi:MAG: hypothetical protein ACI8RP_000077 [Urechidicola sp.]|jgi:hypothetical protein